MFIRGFLVQDFFPKIEQLAQEVAAREGCLIYDLEFTPQRVLRVFLDKAQGQVSVDDCANVSRGLNLMLDVEDVIPGGPYNLEVSSPGLERVLKKPEHYTKALGLKIWVRVNTQLLNLGVEDKKLGSAKQIQAQLKEQNETGIKLFLDGLEIQVPWSAIEKAKTVFEFGPENGGPKPKNPHQNKKKM